METNPLIENLYLEVQDFLNRFKNGNDEKLSEEPFFLTRMHIVVIMCVL